MKRKMRKLCTALRELLPSIQKLYEEREGEINVLAYMEKWQALVGVQPNFCLWRRTLSEHV